MRDQDQRYQSYLHQLQSLGEFRKLHRERHPSTAAHDEDPEVNRIIESLAYFNVGTQLAAQNNMRGSLERLLAGYFDFMLWPMPAMARVQLLNAEQLVETPMIPEGAALTITAPDGAIGWFRTLHDLPIIHATLERTEVQVLEDGFRLLVPMRSPYPVRGLPGPLSLQVHYLDRYVASLRLIHNLRRHLKGVSAFYDKRPSDGKQLGAPCEVHFGAVIGSASVCTNPLERLRTLLHYPELELSLQVAVPQAERQWTRLFLAFDLDGKWPDSRAAVDPFVLHSVPVTNLRRAAAATIRHDGLRFDHPILPNERERSFDPAGITGVYELGGSGQGMTPIPPSGLPGIDEGYEIERIETQSGMRYRIILRLPDAVAKPRNVGVEMDWHQPAFNDSAHGALKVGLADRYIDGLQMRVLGSVRNSTASPLSQLSSVLLELLALRMKRTLRLEELIALLRLLGVNSNSPFNEIMGHIRELTVDTTPDLGAVSARYRYKIRFDAIGPADEALAWTLTSRIRELLDAWAGGEAVSVDLEINHNLGAAKR